MAGVEIDADGVADRIAQPKEGFDIVDVLMAVQFEAELPDAEAVRIDDELAPEGEEHLLPLIAQDCLRLGRPAGRHPIGVRITRPAWTTRHHHHALDPRQACQHDGLACDLAMAPAVLARMERVARTVESADR